MGFLALQKGIIYGPISSRRLGTSLGINVLPLAAKLCSYDCIYCQYGPTKYHAAFGTGFEDLLPSVGGVTEALAEALSATKPPDYITFSGNGEPTLHPGFPVLVEAVRSVRDKLCPGTKLAVLSNSSTVCRPDIRTALALVDAPIMKLDAGSAGVFAAVNVPAARVVFETVLAGLAAVEGLIIQSCFVTGDTDNAGDEAVADYVRVIKNIQPSYVQIYTTDRPVARAPVRRVPPERLAAIGRRVCEEAGVSADFY